MPIVEIEKCSASEVSSVADPIRRNSELSQLAKGVIIHSNEQSVTVIPEVDQDEANVDEQQVQQPKTEEEEGQNNDNLEHA